MRMVYENELRSLQSWINDVNRGLSVGMAIKINPTSAKNVCYQIRIIRNGVENEYPFYATELYKISLNLFMESAYGISLNSAAFGELFVIIRHYVTRTCQYGCLE